MPLIRHIYQRPDLARTDPNFCNVHLMENNDKSEVAFRRMMEILKTDFPEASLAHTVQGRVYRSPDFPDFAILAYQVVLTQAQLAALSRNGWRVFSSVAAMMPHSWHSLHLRPPTIAECS